MQRLVEYVAVSGLPRDGGQLCTIGEVEGFHGNHERYKPVLLDRLPEAEYANAALPTQLPMCCLPEGVKLAANTPACPSTYPLVLTDASGVKLYVCCIAFYDSISNESDVCRVPGNLQGLKALKCVSIISRWPFINTYLKVLLEIHQAVFISGLQYSLHDTLHTLLAEVPVPKPGGAQVLFTVENAVLSISQPPPGLPFIEMSLEPLLRCLDCDILPQLFAAVLVERSVLLRSSSYTKLTQVAEILSLLLHPLRWAHVYIPVVPYSLVEAVEAPTPFLMGLHSSATLPPAADIDVIVDLDDSRVELGTHMNKSMLEFPSELSRLLRQRLRALSCLTWVAEQGAAISFPALRCDHPADLQDPLPCISSADLKGRRWGAVHDSCLRGMFFSVLQALLSGAELCVQQRSQGKAAADSTAGRAAVRPALPGWQLFDSARFLAQSARQFGHVPDILRRLVTTQSFDIYICGLSDSLHLQRSGPAANVRPISGSGNALRQEHTEVDIVTVLPPRQARLLPDQSPLRHETFPWLSSPSAMSAAHSTPDTIKTHRRFASHGSRKMVKMHGHKQKQFLGSLDSGSAAALEQGMQSQILMRIRAEQQCMGIRQLLCSCAASPAGDSNPSSASEGQRYRALLCEQSFLGSAEAIVRELLHHVQGDDTGPPRTDFLLPDSAFSIVAAMLRGLSQAAAAQEDAGLQTRVMLAGSLVHRRNASGVQEFASEGLAGQDHWYNTALWEKEFLRQREESEPETAKLCMLARLAIRLHMDSEGTWDMLKTLRFRHVRHQPLEADASELLVECRYAEYLESTRRKLLASGLPPSYGGGQRVPDDNEPGHHSGSAPSGEDGRGSNGALEILEQRSLAGGAGASLHGNALRGTGRVLWGDGYTHQLEQTTALMMPRAGHLQVSRLVIPKESKPVTALHAHGGVVAGAAACKRFMVACVRTGASIVGTVPRDPAAQQPHITCLQLVSAPEMLATGLSNGRVALWDIQRACSTAQWAAHSDAGCTCLQAARIMTSASPVLMSGGSDGQVCLWDVRKPGSPELRMGAGARPVSAIRCEGSSPLVLVAARDKLVGVWDVRKVGSSPLWWLHGHTGPVTDASMFAQNRAVTTSADWTARIWDLGRGQCETVLSGHAGPVRCAVAQHYNEWVVVTGGEDGTVRAWVNKATRQEGWRACQVVEVHSAAVVHLAASQQSLVSVAADATAVSWDMRCLRSSGMTPWRPSQLQEYGSRVTSASLDSDTGLCTGSEDGAITHWEI